MKYLIKFNEQESSRTWLNSNTLRSISNGLDKKKLEFILAYDLARNKPIEEAHITSIKILTKYNNIDNRNFLQKKLNIKKELPKEISITLLSVEFSNGNEFEKVIIDKYGYHDTDSYKRLEFTSRNDAFYFTKACNAEIKRETEMNPLMKGKVSKLNVNDFYKN